MQKKVMALCLRVQFFCAIPVVLNVLNVDFDVRTKTYNACTAFFHL